MTKCFGDRLAKAVLQKHILLRRFVAPAQLAVATKHFLSAELTSLSAELTSLASWFSGKVSHAPQSLASSRLAIASA